MEYYDIIANLHRCGYPPCRVANNLNISRSVVSEVIHGTTTSYNVASYIASVTNLPLSKLWPGKYQAPPRQSAASQPRRAAA